MILDDKKLENVNGGAALTSAIINALANVMKVLFSAGEAAGASFKRISDGNICR